MMVDINWVWQKLNAEREFCELDGDAFEHRFQTIAKRLWKTDFTATIPMGKRGDLKCDGFRHSTGTVYQCYGPRYGQANVGAALLKIDQDLKGAKEHWGQELKEWKFVYNLYRDKVPSEIVRKIAELSRELEVSAAPFDRSDILGMIELLDGVSRSELYGSAPNATAMATINYHNLGRALTAIRRAISADPLKPVPLSASLSDKVKKNELSAATESFLTIGQVGVPKVEAYLASQADPEESERMAEGFKNHYENCVARGDEPEHIFSEMLKFAGGATGQSERDAAALAIVTRFFVTCQIFEVPAMSEVK
ncbi:ABC-three component system protein [Asaia bogorensis]|uniref:ABC-three component systems C-terminal domain-containing protein n=1 Tax=Asaia bogorensis NBRC 16594 TaxID=1231624 RepID=A0AAN4R1W4_9PROT|nr:ABC-three component system protein [Asaia bogorensis]BAT18354.1 hypothetical protein Asbog_00037 [Asaia bogorensis NBRC 16594]GBQ74518.1 hypothetical protein AA0311_0559 [Asaia bogorensis NBRC 16594]GEL52697.1 hypothetical protein ABO01nite_07040 [Asaia bogorensis NBRC 16594]